MKYTFDDFVEIIAKLRGENGCPWDKEQTLKSLKPYVIEEAYETCEAADVGGIKLADELGDLMLQIVLMAQIGSEEKNEENHFDMGDVINCVCEKMIRRHPHVFGSVTANTSEEVLKNWDEIKRSERGDTNAADELKSVSKALPALMRAQKIQKKASKYGFEFNSLSDAINKLEEEITEVKDAVSSKNREKIDEEIGDMLFSAVNIARLAGSKSETALQSATEKFVRRFEYAQNVASNQGISLENMTPKQLDEVWESCKMEENKPS